MLVFGFILAVVSAFFVGYRWRDMHEDVEVLKEEVRNKIDKPEEKPDSLVVDALDPIQEAQFELEQSQKRLNNE